MTDYITHCTDTAALVTELLEKAPHFVNVDEQGSASFLVSKTPTVRNGAETLALVRDIDGSLFEASKALTTLTVLGTYDEVFADPAKKAIYDRVYVRSYTYIDDGGIERTALRPEKFGIFY